MCAVAEYEPGPSVLDGLGGALEFHLIGSLYLTRTSPRHSGDSLLSGCWMSGPEMAIEFIAELDDTVPKKATEDVNGG